MMEIFVYLIVVLAGGIWVGFVWGVRIGYGRSLGRVMSWRELPLNTLVHRLDLMNGNHKKELVRLSREGLPGLIPWKDLFFVNFSGIDLPKDSTSFYLQLDSGGKVVAFSWIKPEKM